MDLERKEGDLDSTLVLYTVMILSFPAFRSRQTVQTQIRLFRVMTNLFEEVVCTGPSFLSICLSVTNKSSRKDFIEK